LVIDASRPSENCFMRALVAQQGWDVNQKQGTCGVGKDAVVINNDL
jgi:hypothetical protein